MLRRCAVSDAPLKQANGFYGSKGISGRIPEGYTLLEQRFWKGIENSNRAWNGAHGVQLHEWDRDQWTYHAKGIWVTPGNDNESSSPYPVMTLFGSTNLNSRSANLDTELAFIMLLPESEEALPLRKALSEEVNNLRGNASPWLGGQRKVRVGTKALVGMVGGML
jgi:CDP-diacylglycerol--glycerol-3-phosphate 3-phosphatidyltransferase